MEGMEEEESGGDDAGCEGVGKFVRGEGAESEDGAPEDAEEGDDEVG